MEAAKIDFVSVEDYLDGEKISEEKHEYLDGVVYAMAGTSRSHNLISQNLSLGVRDGLRGGPCKVFIADLKVHIHSQTSEIFYYPDVVVTCDPSDADPYIIERPAVIVEVLSETTERIDRREKLFAYRSLESLRQYVIVSQDRFSVESLHRGSAGGEDWAFEKLTERDDQLALPSLDLSISLESIYEGVAWDS